MATAVLILILLGVGTTPAAPPTLDFLFPAGGQRGTKIEVTVGGKQDPWPVQVWTDTPGLKAQAAEGKGKLTIEIDGTVPSGPHLLRLYNEEGASAPRCFVVSQVVEELEKEPNDRKAEPQKISTLPRIVNGRFEKSGDTDFYAVTAEAGKWLIASVDAYGLGTGMDPALHLFDSNGVRLAFNHDKKNLDPFLAWEVKESGTYVFQIVGFGHPPEANVRFATGPGTIYRLHITQGPFAEYLFPPAVRRDRECHARAFGWNLPSEFLACDISSSQIGAFQTQLDVELPGALNSVAALVEDSRAGEEVLEETASTNQMLNALPCAVNGRIEGLGDEDRFSFKAAKDQRLSFRLESAALGFPVNGALTIQDKDGKELSSKNNAEPGEDPTLDWTVPSDGQYAIVVSELSHQGGPNYVYRLLIQTNRSDYTFTSENHAFQVEAGQTTEITVNVSSRRGTAKLMAVIEPLPPGATCEPVEIPEKGGELKLKISAAKDAKPAQGFIRIIARGEGGLAEKAARYSLKIKDSRGGRLLITDTDQLWLTVLKAK